MGSHYISRRLKRRVNARADGRCEYCLIAESLTFARHEVDHVIPLKHGGETTVDNLALSCVLCNKHKGSDLTAIDPQTEEIVQLFNPRKDKWGDNFRLQGGKILGKTAVGRATARLLQLNRPERIAERQLLLSLGLFKIPE